MLATGRAVLAWLIIAAGVAPVLMAGPSGLLSSSAQTKAKGLRFTLPLDGRTPILLVRCGQLSLERARLGMFKVGLIPALLIDDLELTVVDTSRGRGWAEEFFGFLRGEPRGLTLSIRRLAVKNHHGKIRLRAEKAEKRAAQNFLDLELVRIGEDPFEFFFRRARLLLDGPDAGRLEVPDHVDKLDPIIDR